jgi:hypothetical protein
VTDRASYYRPTPFETAASWVHGTLAEVPFEMDCKSPREVLADLLRHGLARPPCFVAFSGGRDSSAVLAVATALARAEGLDDPIPVTELYPDIPESDESDWQRRMIDHLGLGEWIRLTFHHENDLLGDTACQGLLDRGLIWPPALQIKPNTLRSLSPGILLTGEGGDEAFGPRRAAAWAHLSRRTSVPRPAALRGAVESVLPRPVRLRRAARELRNAGLQPWLKPAIAEDHIRLLAQDLTSEPLRWDRAMTWLTRRRAAAATSHNYRLVAAEHGISLMEPLLDPAFLRAWGRVGGRFGFPGRTSAMRTLFGDVLPAAVVERGDKALFNRAFLGESTRRFALTWDGTGLDEHLVDAERLRQEWLAERPSAISSVLLQAAWLQLNGPGQPNVTGEHR